MSEIGERAEKIWREQTEMIRREKELVAAQTEHYANLILEVFEASNELYYVSTVIVSYDLCYKCLNCSVQFFDDIDGETGIPITYSLVVNDKLMKAMNNVNACEAADNTIIARIYDLLVRDLQVTKYFEVTSDEDSQIVIKMRPEEDVTLNETICENEEPEE